MPRRLALLAVFTVACANHKLPPVPDAPSATISSISVTPADQDVTIDGAVPAAITYAVTGTFDDGHTEDVTSRARFSLSNTGVGMFAASAFTSSLTQGGRTRVIADVAGITADTGLVVHIKQAYPDPGATGLPPDPTVPFNGPADASRAPALVYPNDGVLVPPNLRLLEIHFQPGTNNTLFEISFENALTDIRVYTRCATQVNGGCVYTPDAKVWQWIAETNRGGDPVVVHTRATDDTGTGVGTSSDIKVAFSYEDVKGGIYYWKAAAGANMDSAIMRYNFGDVAQTTAERFVGPDLAGGKCVGCHALSRDGTKLVASAGGWDVKDILMVDVMSATRIGTPVKTAFASWNPSGSQYVGVYADASSSTFNLMLVDSAGTLGSVIDVGASSTNATSHPDWSPDGKSIAYVREGQAYEQGVNNQRFYQGGIQIVKDGGGGTFGQPIDVVPAVAGKNHYYPSFSPDSKLLAFDESTCPTGSAHQDCNADSDPSATMFVVPPAAGATPISLANANAPGPLDPGTSLTNSWPKWAPFEFQRTTTPGSRLVWLTFSSTRHYGLRTPPAATNTEAVSGTLLWMVAIDPERAAAGLDPSYTAFCLPFQDVTSSNHIAQWTTDVIQ